MKFADQDQSEKTWAHDSVLRIRISCDDSVGFYMNEILVAGATAFTETNANINLMTEYPRSRLISKIVAHIQHIYGAKEKLF